MVISDFVVFISILVFVAFRSTGYSLGYAVHFICLKISRETMRKKCMKWYQHCPQHTFSLLSLLTCWKRKIKLLINEINSFQSTQNQCYARNSFGKCLFFQTLKATLSSAMKIICHELEITDDWLTSVLICRCLG